MGWDWGLGTEGLKAGPQSMEFIEELKQRARHVIGPVLGVLVVGYFTYHALHGDRGIFALWRLEQSVAEAEQLHTTIDAKRAQLESRVRLLHPDSLDPDMLEERARAMLNFAHPGEHVFLDPPSARQPDRRSEP